MGMCNVLSNKRSFNRLAKGRGLDFLRYSTTIDLYPGKLRYFLERRISYLAEAFPFLVILQVYF